MLKQVLEEKVYPGSMEKGTKNTSDVKFRTKTQEGEKKVRHHLQTILFVCLFKSIKTFHLAKLDFSPELN